MQDRFPADIHPAQIGRRLVDRFLESGHQYGCVSYSEVATWYGALAFAQLIGDAGQRDKLIARFEPLLPGRSETPLIGGHRHVDNEVFGVVPLEIAIQTGDPAYLRYGLQFADRQWENPRPDGLTAETRYWVDDMYMVTILQLQAWRATGNRAYRNRAAAQMNAYLDKMQQSNGLFHHAIDVPFFWGRGNGWAAAGMTEMLRDLPPDQPQYASILHGYQSMMGALLKQQSAGGMWRQLLDREEAWPEASCSGMFAFAMISGLKRGWLDRAVFEKPARKAWMAVADYVDRSGNVTSVCEGTNKFNSYDYYMQRERRIGDFHGQASVLWAATAWLGR